MKEFEKKSIIPMPTQVKKRLRLGKLDFHALANEIRIQTNGERKKYNILEAIKNISILRL